MLPLALLIFLVPATALAHHPGALGPIAHLGVRQVLITVAAALLDSFNPSALGVLLLLVYGSLQRGGRAVRTGLLYVGGIVTAYLAAGMVLRNVYLHFGPTLPVQIFQIAIALLLFLSGLSELTDAINPKMGKFINIPRGLQPWLSKLIRWLERGFAFPLGSLIGLVELFATGAIYLTFIQAITYDPTARLNVIVAFMAIYLTVFTLPLIVLLLSGQLVQLTLGSRRLTAAGRFTRSVIGLLFMAAAGFIAASAYVTIVSLR